MIDLRVRKRLGQFSLTAELQDSGLICLAGMNGSGKTTLMRIIAGFLDPDDGYVRVSGSDVTILPIERRGVVMVTPNSCLPHLDVDSHLRWGCTLRKIQLPEEHLARVKRELGIDFTGRLSRLSLGMRERVALATVLLASPQTILVDEAFANLHKRDEFITAFRRLCAQSRIDVLFSSQDESDGKLSDHAYSICDGATKRIR